MLKMLYQAGWRSGNDLQPRSAHFEFQPVHRLSWISSVPNRYQDSTFIRPRPLPPNHFQLIIRQSSYQPIICSPDIDSVGSHKKKVWEFFATENYVLSNLCYNLINNYYNQSEDKFCSNLRLLLKICSCGIQLVTSITLMSVSQSKTLSSCVAGVFHTTWLSEQFSSDPESAPSALLCGGLKGG
jgi:hypothetical protein